MTPREINQSLTLQAFEVAKMLLPQGKRDGHEWRVGNLDGDPGKSLGVRISGDKTGVWSDFATGDSGDLLDLWQKTKGISIKDAITEAKSYLGISDPTFHGHREKQYQRPERPKCHKPEGAVKDYLINVRKFTEATLKAFRVGFRDRQVILPFMRDNELIMCKWRSIDDKATQPTTANQEPCLFGWQAIPDDVRHVAITEGEFDAMALYEYGIPALSVPFGGGKGAKQTNWIENEYPHLERFDVIYLALDADKTGREATVEIIERLGRHRCKLVNLPEKDANDCLKEGVSFEQIQQAFDRAVVLDPVELKSAADFRDEIIAEFYPEEGGGERAFNTPWDKSNGNLKFRMAELILINGVNGHGKSQVAGQCSLSAMHQLERVCIASMELPPRRLLGRLTKQAAGLKEGLPTKEYIHAIADWYADKCWIFDVVGTAKTKRLFEVFEYARKRYGITVFVIDSLLKCGIPEDDYRAQKAFVEQLCDFKNKYECVVFLVTHSRKGENEYSPTGKMDVKGSGSITDLADTLITAFRNKKKAKNISKAEQDGESEEAIAKLEEMPDEYLIVDKQRNGEWEGSVALWWCKNSNQYLPFQNSRPVQYVKYQREVA